MCMCVCVTYQCECMVLEIKNGPKNRTSTCSAQRVMYVARALCELTWDFPQTNFRYSYGSCICYDEARLIANSYACGVPVYHMQFFLLICIVEFANQIYHIWMKMEQPSACL